MNGFTKVYHKKSYDRIDPTVRASSQHGRTVLITGGSEGIGYGIAQGFARAKASRIILVARNETKLDAASAQLKSGFQSTEILTRVCDCSDVGQLEALFAHLSSEAIFVDVLILNAGATSNTTTAAEVAAVFHFNVISKIHLLELFQNQKSPNGGSTPRKIAIEISSASVHCYGGYPRTAYPSSKAGFANYLCHMAEHVPETELRLISLHPGAIFTAASAAASPVRRQS
jgi:NAD(P)-dependent dehydrogenase (short-subunit alcohol dehydrogenase family)